MKHSKEKIAFIIINNYFSIEAYFMEEEIRHLSENFDKIYFIDTINMGNNLMESEFSLPFNAELLKVDIPFNFIDRIKSLKYLFFNPIFWKEIKNVRKTYKQKVSIGVIKTLLVMMRRGEMKMHTFEKMIFERCNNFSNLYLYSYWLDENAYAQAKLNLKYPDIKTFARAHNWDIYFEKSKHNYLPLREFIIKNLDALFTVSENGRKYLLEKLPFLSPEKIKVSRLGTKSVNPKSYIKYNNHYIKIISISVVSEVKRIDLMIEAFSLLDNIIVDWSHIGGGEDFLHISKLAEKKLKHKKNITYALLGEKSRKEVYHILSNTSFDFLINVSTHEGIPVSIMEAMSMGIPVVATNVGGVSEIVNNDNGILLGSNPNCEEIKSAIDKFYYMDEKTFSSFRRNAYNTWKTKYNAEINYPEFISQVMNLKDNN